NLSIYHRLLSSFPTRRSSDLGQIDVMPTLLHLLGIRAQDYILFGTDLFSEDHKEFVPFRSGDFITPEYSHISGAYYDNETGEEIKPTEKMKELNQTVQ